MRKNLYRDKRMDNGEWVYGFLCKTYTFKAPHTHDGIMYEVEQGETANWHNFEYMTAIIDPATVGQYTGEEDIIHEEVYEHDIVDVLYKGNIQYRGVVIYGHGSFEIRKDVDELGMCMCFAISEGMEFIKKGNIFDNPELMEKIKTEDEIE